MGSGLRNERGPLRQVPETNALCNPHPARIFRTAMLITLLAALQQSVWTVKRHGTVILFNLDACVADHAAPAFLLSPDIAIELFRGTRDHDHPLIGGELLERLGSDRN